MILLLTGYFHCYRMGKKEEEKKRRERKKCVNVHSFLLRGSNYNRLSS